MTIETRLEHARLITHAVMIDRGGLELVACGTVAVDALDPRGDRDDPTCEACRRALRTRRAIDAGTLRMIEPGERVLTAADIAAIGSGLKAQGS